MMKVSGWHLLLTASLLLSMSTGVAAHASGSKDGKAKAGKAIDANEEIQALLDKKVLTGDYSAKEQFYFADEELEKCHLNSTSAKCKTDFDAAVKVANNGLKKSIEKMHNLVGDLMGFDVEEMEEKLKWLKQNNRNPKRQMKIKRKLEQFNTAAASLKQTSQVTVSCEIGGLEEGQFTKRDFDDFREEFEAVINKGHILNNDDTYMKNFTWDDEATETETQVRDLAHSHGRQLRRKIKLTGGGTNGCKCCNKNNAKEDRARTRKRRRLPGRSGGSFKSTKGHSGVESKNSKSNKKPMLDMWEKCTEGFTLKHVNEGLATLITNKIGSQEDNKDFSVSCCFT
jgi:hypothetical protein